MEEKIRLSKLMSERGLCSRREADRYIEEGQILVDGQAVTELGTKVSRTADVSFKPRAEMKQKNKVTILLNKPLGYVSTQPEDGYLPAKVLILPENQFEEDFRPLTPSHLRNLNVAGRLDIDSKGLLIFTQDGTVVKQIIGPDASIEKEYLVGVEGFITGEVLRSLRSGLYLDGKALKPAKVECLEPQLLRIILREGKNRQIRRMCELVDLRVVKLKRVRVGKVRLGRLPEGHWRFLQDGESF